MELLKVVKWLLIIVLLLSDQFPALSEALEAPSVFHAFRFWGKKASWQALFLKMSRQTVATDAVALASVI